ncbi:MAG: tetratricopeptide repeat protein [Hydrogenophilaceae bacterium]|nr:tetratricopeptide repeat protein [Hydrogenophilaceae bacterium]
MPNMRNFASILFLAFIAIPGFVIADDIQDINQLFRKGDLNGAQTRVNQYLAKNPKDAQARFLKGLILADQNKTTEAIQVFTALTDDYPELPEPYNNLAVLYAAQGKYDAAKNALEMAIRTHPSYATAHENLGDLYAKMATIAYDKALQLDSGNKTAQTKLSLIKDMMSGGQERRPVMTASAKSETRTATAVTTQPPMTKSDTKPASKTAAAPASDKDDVIMAIQSWAKAWSAKDVDGYLGHYAPDFSPSSMSRSEWASQRRERILAPKNISVSANDIQIVKSTGNRATVRFKQAYESDRMKSTSGKTMELGLIDGKWLILRESGR